MILYLEYVGFSKNGGLSPDCGYFIGNKSNWPVNWDFEHKKWMRTKTKNLRTGMLRVENLKFGCWANQKKDFEHKTFGLTANQLQDFWPSTMLDRSQNRVHHPREQWNIHEHWPLILGKNKVFCSPCALGAPLPSASWHPGAIREGQDRGALPWSQGTGHFWECGDNIEFRTQFCDPCAFMVQWFKLIYEVRGYSKTVESYSTKFIPDILVLLLYWRE